MSTLSLYVIQSQQHDIQCMIYDVQNEINTIEKDLNTLETHVSDIKKQYDLLKKQLQEKQNLFNDSVLLMNIRQTQINNDKLQEKKIIYSLRCQQYLTTFSKLNYNFQNMCSNEIISVAQKLHFIQCLKHHFQSHPPTPNLPNNENDFDIFEKTHHFQDNIYLSPTLFVQYSTWSQISEYNNQLPFTIDSDMSSLNLEMHHRLNPSFEISWTITS